MLNKKIIIASVLLICLLASTASATTLNVGTKEKYKTIQSAVNAAKNGDTIKVSSGTYKQRVYISNKKITIQGIKEPTVNGFDVENHGSATINGFNIVAGNGYSGISLDSGKNVIQNNIIVAKNNFGLCIDVKDVASMPTVTANTFKNCFTAVDFADTTVCPNKLSTFKNNKYINCNINFGCDIDLN